ncbi:MAG: hypothetical protein ACRDRS_00255 [Pseudonocardiaceae bacterium]
MSMTAVIGLGIATWVLVAIPLALVVARVIRLRDRQSPGQKPQEAPAEGKSGNGNRRLV